MTGATIIARLRRRSLPTKTGAPRDAWRLSRNDTARGRHRSRPPECCPDAGWSTASTATKKAGTARRPGHDAKYLITNKR